MSEEFNKDLKQENTANTGSQETAGENKQEQSAAGGQTTGGTTYSWVNPKLHQGASENSQANGNPWSNGTTGSWQSQGAAGGRHSQGGYGQNQQAQSGYAHQTQGSQNYGQQGQYQQGYGRTTGTASGQNYQYSAYQAGSNAAAGTGKKAKKMKVKKPKKPMTAGKKWMVNVAMALVFGLVAGTVFYGVNAAGGQLTGNSNASASVSTPISNTSTVGGSDSTTTPTSNTTGSEQLLQLLRMRCLL